MKTVVLKIDPENVETVKIKLAGDVVRKGGLVVFPTETVYGLGADATNDDACKRIYKAKGRPQDNPLIVHISSMEDLYRVSKKVPESAKPFIERLWPGPLTVIVEKSDVISEVASAGLPTIGVRMPAHPIAQELIKAAGVPIAAPSANLSGRPSPTKAEHVIEDLNGKVDLIIDGGDTMFGIESTIIDFTKEKPVLLRPGPLYPEQLLEIGKVIISDIARGDFYQEKPLSPGMKYRHYAPEKPLILIENRRKVREVIDKYKKVILLCTEEDAVEYNDVVEDAIILGSLKEPFVIAKNIFHALRVCDKKEGDVIIALGFPERGILFSVMNRLRKAASEVIK